MSIPSNQLRRNHGGNSDITTLTWIIDNKYLDNNSFMEAIDRTMKMLSSTKWGAVRIDKSNDCKTVLIISSVDQILFDSILYILTRFVEFSQEYIKSCFTIKWSGLKDSKDGKLKCKFCKKFDLWLFKICYKDENDKVINLLAATEKKWVIPLF